MENIEESRRITAEEWKLKGNEFFKRCDFSSAIEAYSKAIALFPTSIMYVNRATCNFQLENYGSAIADCNSAIDLDAKYGKAYYRRGCCYVNLRKLKEAVEDFTKLCQIDPQNREGRERIKEIKAQIKGM
jgi:serine/threonine-protein phosphatase 5